MQKITFRKIKHFKWQHFTSINYILCIDGKRTRYFIYNDGFDNHYLTCHLLNKGYYNYESICNAEGRCRFYDIDQAKRFMVEYLNREPHELKDTNAAI
jgi:hypothetical protein